MVMNYRDAIFVVTEERSCPLYNVGEEFRVEKMELTVPQNKPACLNMVQSIIQATTEEHTFERLTQHGIHRAKFECGGCEGLIRFEFKNDKEFATLQMKLLAAAERRERLRTMDNLFDLLRNLKIFESLDDDSLNDLAELLKLETFDENKVVLKKGEPGTQLYFVLEGKVAVLGSDNKVLSELGSGEIFGELSLLSGEPVTTTVHTRAKTKLAILSARDFKRILNKYPILQVFFYRMLVERAQANTQRGDNIASGMTGQLAEINTVDLFQLINASQKTGQVEFFLNDGKAVVLFHEGEIVKARYNSLSGKDAVFALLGKRSGQFVYTSGIPEEAKKLDVIGGFMGLIMEGLRRLDEREASQDQVEMDQ